ncbi:redoxin domain-containing protein [bacterium]|nr:redoxin domain-containing protein [bacterium]
MSRKTFRRLSVLVLAVGFGLAAAFAADEPAQKPQIGKPAPDFELKDIEGKTHKLSDYKGKPVVVEFWNCGCPWVVGTEKDRNANVEKYKDKAVFLSVDPTNGNTDEIRKNFRSKHNSSYTLLVDEGNKVADLYKANQTPEVFVVDKEGTLIYHGAFDNRSQPNTTGDVNYIASALDAALEGKPVEKTETKAFGCTIKRVR